MSSGLTPARVEKALESFLPSGSRILVAVSGGPDSVALAALLKELPYNVVIGHVEHGLRAGSLQDARFVRALADEWDIPFMEARMPVRARAASEGMGIEEAARFLRYQALTKMAQRTRCRAIVTGHNADDQAETVLMNFLRGAGASGLAGMPAERPLARGVRLLRPLMDTPRREILAYLKRHHLRFRQDPSNRNRRFFRNRIRHETLPYLESLQPGLRARLQSMAEIFRGEEDFWSRQKALRSVVSKRLNDRRIVIDLPRFFGYHKALSRRILHACMPGLSFPDLEQVLSLGRSASPSGSLSFRGGWRITKNADRLTIRGGKNK